MHTYTATRVGMELSNARRRTAKGGFTLVELLTVIGIIAILATLVFPILARMQDRTLEATSMNQLRQVGAAMIAYSGENDNNFPTARGTLYYTADTSKPENLPWQQQLDQYIGFSGDDLLAVDGPRKIFELPSKGVYQRSGLYAYFLGSHASWAAAEDAGEVAAGQDGFLPVNRARILSPDMLILGGEQGIMKFDDKDADRDDYNMNDPAFGGGKLNHNIQILFADGHVKGYDHFDNKEMTVRYEGVKANGLGYTYGEPVETTAN